MSYGIVTEQITRFDTDLRLAVALGDSLGQPLFSAAAANETFKKAKALGLSEQDFCAVFRAISS